MKLLITGFSGFVSRHFLEYLHKKDIAFDILGIDVVNPQFDYKKECATKGCVDFKECNLLDEKMLSGIIDSFVPDYVLHLASFSSVAYSWKNPSESFRNNTNIFLNLVNAVRNVNENCRILSVGSSEEYGNVVASQIPLEEKQVLRPVNPYAVARVSQEMIAKVFVDSFDMKIVLTRSFNHIGPYQDERFVVPSFIKRIKSIKEANCDEGTIETGDITVIRDFVDVRDVVEAYYILLTKGVPGEVYNICSGRGMKLSEIVSIISESLGVKVKCVINNEYVRPSDNRIVVGSNKKIYDAFGWKPQIKIEQTIIDMIN